MHKLYGPSGMCPDVNQSSYQPSPEIGKLSIGYSENRANRTITLRVSVQGVVSLGCHFATLCREFDFYVVRKIVIIFQKEKVMLIHFKSLL